MKPKYRDKKFKSKENFEKWLNKLTKFKIEFKDDGQDFLKWYLDKRGEVLHCEPFQSSVWNGTMVDIKRRKGREYLPLQDRREIIHKVKKIIEV